MDRMATAEAWRRSYRGKQRSFIIQAERQHVRNLVRVMRRLACWHEAAYKGFKVRELRVVLGMALGIHQQLLRGVTLPSRGVTMEGRR